MKALKLTIEQFNAIECKEYAPYQFFKCIEHNGDKFVCLSSNDKELLNGTEFEFLNSINEEEIILTNKLTYE